LILYRADLAEGGDLVQVLEVLEGCSALDTADLDGDGQDDLLVAREGQLYAVGSEGLVLVLEDAGLVWSSLHPRATRHPELDGHPVVTTAPLGRLVLYGPREGGVEWAALARVELPLMGRAGSDGLVVRNPVPSFVGLDEHGVMQYATWPEELGKQRLKTVRIELDSSTEGSSATECWSRLPEPEEVLERHFLMIDGQPMLLVATKPANKLNLFGEKRLRLYALAPDRSRLGHPPVFAAQSRMNLWQDGTPMMLDVTGDGREDLVLGYWKGLKDDRIVLDAYPRLPDGWFDDTPQTTAFDVKKGDRSFFSYGHDLDGDRLSDLLVRSDDSLVVYRGLHSTSGRKLVDKTPFAIPSLVMQGSPGTTMVQVGSGGFGSWTLPSPGRPRVVDVDGDGTHEILIVRRGSGPDILSVLSLRDTES
jgi:hypothetical protein